MKLKITVHGVAYDVDVEVLDAGEGFPNVLPQATPPVRRKKPASPAPEPAPRLVSSGGAAGAGDAKVIPSPVAGTVLEVRCQAGQQVAENQVVLVIEAMKMKTSIVAPRAGEVAEVLVAAGDPVKEGQALARYA